MPHLTEREHLILNHIYTNLSRNQLRKILSSEEDVNIFYTFFNNTNTTHSNIRVANIKDAYIRNEVALYEELSNSLPKTNPNIYITNLMFDLRLQREAIRARYISLQRMVNDSYAPLIEFLYDSGDFMEDVNELYSNSLKVIDVISLFKSKNEYMSLTNLIDVYFFRYVNRNPF